MSKRPDDSAKRPRESFWEPARMGDGYDRMDAARLQGWASVPSWGRDGWDLGDWPYVVIYHRRQAGEYQLATNVEGDTDVWGYATREERDAATDYLAHYYWRWHKEPWIVGIPEGDEPPHLCGPYSSARADLERAS